MKKINRNSKILSLSHGDFDGIACQIVLGNVFPNIVYTNSEFYNIDKKMGSIDYSQFDYVFVTDIHPDDPKLMDNDKVIMIDHHPSPHHNPSKNRYAIHDKNRCAAYLVKFFCDKLYPEVDLKHLDDLIMLADDYDTWKHKDPRCRDINELIKNFYDVDEFRDRFMTGDTVLNEKEVEYINDRHDKFNKLMDNLELFEFDEFKGCVVFADDFINDVADKLLKEQGYRLVVVRNPEKGRSSVRHNIKGVHIGNILESHNYGGGHEFAAGFFERDSDAFYKKVLVIVDDVDKNGQVHII